MAGDRLTRRVAFDRPDTVPDGFGGRVPGWAEHFVCAAGIRYQRGTEEQVAGALSGTASFKFKVYANAKTRALTAKHRMRDLRSGEVLNIREVDALSDPLWVWIVAESGVAV